MNESDTPRFLARAFTEKRERLLALAERNLKPVLLKRSSPEDVLSATYEACAKRLAYFATHTDVPAYFTLRTLLFQELADLERKTASIRHVRALERLQRKLTEVSCFRRRTGRSLRCNARLNPSRKEEEKAKNLNFLFGRPRRRAAACTARLVGVGVVLVVGRLVPLVQKPPSHDQRDNRQHRNANNHQDLRTHSVLRLFHVQLQKGN